MVRILRWGTRPAVSVALFFRGQGRERCRIAAGPVVAVAPASGSRGRTRWCRQSVPSICSVERTCSAKQFRPVPMLGSHRADLGAAVRERAGSRLPPSPITRTATAVGGGRARVVASPSCPGRCGPADAADSGPDYCAVVIRLGRRTQLSGSGRHAGPWSARDPGHSWSGVRRRSGLITGSGIKEVRGWRCGSDPRVPKRRRR